MFSIIYVASGIYDKMLITIIYYGEYHDLSLKYNIYSSYTTHLSVYAKLCCVISNKIQKNIIINLLTDIEIKYLTVAARFCFFSVRYFLS